MNGSGRGLIGATIRIGDDASARVTGALVDGSGRAVLFRVALAGEIAYVPRAALESPSAGVVRISGPHVLLRRAEVGFYEEVGGLEWISAGDVSDGAAMGMVGHECPRTPITITTSRS